MRIEKTLSLVVSGLITLGVVGCTQDPDDGVPKACEGEAKISTPMGYWKARGSEQKSGAQMTLLMSIGTSVTEVGIQCESGSSKAETSKVIESDYDDSFLTLEKTGVIEIDRDGLSCRLEEMGGVYELSYAGSCLKIQSTKGFMYLEPNKLN